MIRGIKTMAKFKITFHFALTSAFVKFFHIQTCWFYFVSIVANRLIIHTCAYISVIPLIRSATSIAFVITITFTSFLVKI